jgi:C1A family cysteine protease
MAKDRRAVETIAADAVNLGWSAGETDFSRLSEAEQLARLGYNPEPSSGEMPLEVREQVALALASHPSAAADAVGAPAAVDLRSYNGHNYITVVRDQGACGSCVSFGTIATVEGTMRFVGRNDQLAVDLSEGHLFNCIARSQGRSCGTGWWVDPAMTALRDQGVVDEACSPYSSADVPCMLCANWQSRLTKIRGYQQLNTLAAMKEWISTKGPLAACFSVYTDFGLYRSGVYRKTATATLRGGHCISVVGYDDAQGAWICKNSWGTGWGEAGFFRIAYGQCGIDASMWGVEVGAVPPGPSGLAPLHRYWNPGIGDHFYTTNWGELGGGRFGWQYEGVQCDISVAPGAGLVPLYRYWNGAAGDHFYTTSWGELGGGRYGWRYEGIQGYVAAAPRAGLLPLYRYWNGRISDHFYTTDWTELGGGRHGWAYEGIQCYVWPRSATAAAEDVPESFRVGGGPAGAGSAPAGGDAPPPGSSFDATGAGFAGASSFSSEAPTVGRPASFVTDGGSGEGPPSRGDPTNAGDCGCAKPDEVRVAWVRR